jgi:hypothetical protein
VAVNVALLCVFQRLPIDFLDILVTGGAHMEPLRIYDPKTRLNEEEAHVRF